MSRTVPEWIGRTSDSVPPPRVKLRILKRHNNRCYLTGHEFRDGDRIEFDHIVALCNGGANCESNLAPVLADKHKEKTRSDVEQRAKTDRMVKKRFRLSGRGRSRFRNSRDGDLITRLTSDGPRTERR